MDDIGTPVRERAAASYGHVLVNEKWRGSAIAQGFQDMVIGNNYKRKLARIGNATSLRGIVLVEKTRISEQYFQSVQKFVVLELGMTLLPVAGQTEAS
ncbi:Fanconi anemia core complex-associated protein 24 [Acipenser ruthenus]|uniref:Fanconi anemia core complex-associated protein 24 n=1 Tax=Acipenser ruthenus TaxID=7906 RepID=A0A444UL87_ACIRT|nr:Fanconi anemia core complex-associated protein 24 [Acipenser ruthenus]